MAISTVQMLQIVLRIVLLLMIRHYLFIRANNLSDKSFTVTAKCEFI